MRWIGGWLMSIMLYTGPVGALELAGTLNWLQRTELGTPVSGVVASVPAVAGQRVARGAELLRLDDRGFKAEVSEAQAHLAGAKARHDEARREEERAAELYDRTVLSDHERQVSLIAFQEAASALQVAQARLTKARLDLERSRIVAPYDALVVRVDAAPGETIVSELQAKPLLVVAEAGRMRVQAQVRASQLADFMPGTAARVRVRDQWFDGAVTGVGLEPVARDADGPFYELNASFSLPAGERLHVGEPATVKIGD